MKIDNFALVMHQTCPTKFKRRMMEGWQLRRRSGALGFGAAFHAGLAAWYKTEGEFQTRFVAGCQAITEGWDSTVPVDDYRTLSKCLDVFREYCNEYRDESFSVVGIPDRPVVEQTFTLALGTYLPCRLSFIDVETGWDAKRRGCTEANDMFESVCKCGLMKEAIEYGGIFDTLIEFNGKVYILEHKTTSQLGDYYFNQFKPNNQVTGYIWAAQQMSGLDVAGALINAIGAFRVGKTKLKRQLTTRDALDIAEWVRNVTATCEEIAQHKLNGVWPMRTGSCTQYGLCEFHQVCTLSDPHWRQKRLETDYVQSTWDYTKRDDNAEGTTT